VIQGEKEILLHPNMSFIVDQEPYFGEDGYWNISLLQISDSSTYIF